MEVVEVALTPKEIMGDGLKMLNFQESKGLYVLFFLKETIKMFSRMVYYEWPSWHLANI